ERKRRLINGLDDIGLTLQYEDQIRSFETEDLKKYPW
ncbi:MAG: 3-isopropylmalate dehydratase small subunit, partial [SAR86 cluster bacterium]|nr:3-isopropylmalate dehydratase small subunit [SAR86 cluster bacterium]